MKRVASTTGFTIVEAMVVLAVTGALFIVTATTWSGKQRSTEYQTALRDARSLVQQTMSDVQNGYFPSTGSFTCTKSGSAVRFAAGGPSADNQGSNSDCVFLGKALQFGLVDGNGIETIKKYSVAGLKDGRILGPGATSVAPTLVPTLTENPYLKADLNTSRISVIGRAGTYNGLLVVSDMGLYDSDGTLESGRQSVKVYGLLGPLTEGPMMGDGMIPAGKPLNVSPNRIDPVAITTGIRICLKSGGTENFGVLTVGLGGTVADVKTQTVVGSCPV